MIIPIMLCGGSGIRLWPLSTPEKPKQFHDFGTKYSLFQEAMLRVQLLQNVQKPIVIANLKNKILLQNQLNKIGLNADILLEIHAYNTSVAVAVGCMRALQQSSGVSSDTIILITPCDHLIEDNHRFAKTINLALPLAKAGYIVSFAIDATYPTTEYGYLCPGKPLTLPGTWVLEKFSEKPDFKLAKRLIEKGSMWNSGIYLLSARCFLDELERLTPDIARAAYKAFGNMASTSSNQNILGAYKLALHRAISVDYAVMEKTRLGAMLHASFKWADIASYVGRFPLTGSLHNCQSGEIFEKKCFKK